MAPSDAEWKLLTLKAKNYATNLYGVNNIKYLMADSNKLSWHRNALKQLLQAPVMPEDMLPAPYSKMDAMRWVSKKLKLKPGSFANILFEDFILISFQLTDLEEFILCSFQLNISCNFSLFLFEPDAVVVLHENGSGLSFAVAMKRAGFI